MMPIESAFQIALTDRAGELAIWANQPPLSSEGSEAWAEQAFANVYGDYITTGSRLSETSEDPAIRVHLAAVDSASERLAASRTLPDKLFADNMYVHPSHSKNLRPFFAMRRRSPCSALFSHSLKVRTKTLLTFLP